MKVKVELWGRALPQQLVAGGEGSSRFSSRGLVFEPRKDVVFFDETTIGRITKAAVKRAVTRLLELPPSLF